MAEREDRDAEWEEGNDQWQKSSKKEVINGSVDRRGREGDASWWSDMDRFQ